MYVSSRSFDYNEINISNLQIKQGLDFIPPPVALLFFFFLFKDSQRVAFTLFLLRLMYDLFVGRYCIFALIFYDLIEVSASLLRR